MPADLGQPISDPIERFIAVQQALHRSGDWIDHQAWTRFAALAAVTAPLDPTDAAARIRTAADTLSQGARWFSDLSSPFRFVIAAVLVTDGADVAAFARELPANHDLFRSVGVRHGGQYETLAIAILRHFAPERPVERAAVDRLKAVYDGFKRYHWWLTGPDDLPSCACLTILPGSPDAIATRVDQHYRLLREYGFAGGNHLLHGAALLALCGLSGEAAVARFAGVATALGKADLKLWHEDYDALALLCLLDQDAAIVVPRLKEILVRLATLTPPITGQIQFNLAADLTILDMLRCDARGIRLHTSQQFAGLLERLQRFTAGSLLLSASSDSLIMPADTPWPLGSPLYPLGGGLP